MKQARWIVFAAAFAVLVIMLAFRAGYTVGADMAERDNRADRVE